MSTRDPFSDLDYFVTRDGIFYLVKGYYHPPGGVFAYPVFWPDPRGSRLHPRRGRYSKVVSDFNEKIFRLHPEYCHAGVPRNTPIVAQGDIVEIFRPRSKIPGFLETDRGTVWYSIFEYLLTHLHIPEEDIGIFGSRLIDLDRGMDAKRMKDVDFAIYGLENLSRVRKGINGLLVHFGFSHISPEHINYHTKKFGSLFEPTVNSFARTLVNKWSAIQVAPGLLTTLRFVYKQNEIPPNPIPAPIQSATILRGKVIDDRGTNFMPRVFPVAADARQYTVVTYFWAFQSCVRRGDHVVISGDLHQDGTTVSVDAADHGIKIVS